MDKTKFIEILEDIIRRAKSYQDYEEERESYKHALETLIKTLSSLDVEIIIKNKN